MTAIGTCGIRFAAEDAAERMTTSKNASKFPTKIRHFAELFPNLSLSLSSLRNTNSNSHWLQLNDSLMTLLSSAASRQFYHLEIFVFRRKKHISSISEPKKEEKVRLQPISPFTKLPIITLLSPTPLVSRTFQALSLFRLLTIALSLLKLAMEDISIHDMPNIFAHSSADHMSRRANESEMLQNELWKQRSRDAGELWISENEWLCFGRCMAVRAKKPWDTCKNRDSASVRLNIINGTYAL